ncbi:endo-1,4-beta-xylanase [Novipirellula herctigrandis]|uniref:endo-1,4-beta-xylanase n=1 Tax=Novipirellula herctigrandis TaxID=2527986 RepID=UPI003AF3333B
MPYPSRIRSPRENGYSFETADALVEFATGNDMALAGHTLVWHSQTPNWVLDGTHLPPGTSDALANNEAQASLGIRRNAEWKPFWRPTWIWC